MTKINEEFKRKIGQLLIIGFHGNEINGQYLKTLKNQIKNGLIGGLVFFKYNIIDKKQITELISEIKKINTEFPLFISLDEEGGNVSRLVKSKGFFDLKSAKEVASNFSLKEAYNHYLENSKEMSEIGFNLNFAPCVDIDFQEGSSVIGGLKRAYSNEKSKVISYAEQMIKAQKESGILSCIKHFPGHGSAKGDTHEGLVDITNDYKEEEYETFKSLFKTADAIMPAHLINKNIDPKLPVSLSASHLQSVKKNFKGLVISDCLHMGAIIKSFSLEEVVLNSINAGVDILLFSNNPLAAKTDGIKIASDNEQDYAKINDWVVPDIDLPVKFQEVVTNLIKERKLNIDLVLKTNDKIINFKK